VVAAQDGQRRRVELPLHRRANGGGRDVARGRRAADLGNVDPLAALPVVAHGGGASREEHGEEQHHRESSEQP
jgi:hypothetical protein